MFLCNRRNDIPMQLLLFLIRYFQADVSAFDSLFVRQCVLGVFYFAFGIYCFIHLVQWRHYFYQSMFIALQ